MNLRRGALGLLIALLVGQASHAGPWAAPGDELLRHDLELLADAGLVHGPVTTWPISWPDVSRDVQGWRVEDVADSATAQALLRVQRRARGADGRGFQGMGFRLAGASDTSKLRSFGDSPREEGEAALRAEWLSDHVSVALQGAAVADASDGKTWRPDGSQLALNLGNFAFSVGYVDRWWGPGWDGSLILSTNARPIPSLTVERNYAEAFRTPLLSWLGPWRATFSVGASEDSGVAVPGVRFMAARVNVKPRPWLEIGVSRTAQWCGDGRPCGFAAFKDMLLGRDNRGGDLSASDEPGNQMAGYDLRLRSPWKALPLTLYTQWIGEDEAGGLPSKFMGQFGAETWWSTNWGGARLRLEYTDTTCVFTRQNPEFGCGFRNSLYPQGYTYRGRIIGHTLDNDSQAWSLSAMLATGDGSLWNLVLRRLDLNRDGGPHAITNMPADVDNVELRYSHEFKFGQIDIGVAWDSEEILSDGSSGVQGHLMWRQGF